MTKTIRNLKALSEHKLVLEEEIPGLKQVTEKFSLSITPQMYELINKNDPDDPIAKQFVPNALELNISKDENTDPIGDDAFTKVKGIIHRYPDRCLFTPVHVCPVYCRFCFRREKVGRSTGTLSPGEMEAAFDYIQSNPEIWEVIITGGDPLILKPEVMKNLIDRLGAIPHVEVIRIHSRVPVVDSKRITTEMVNALRNEKPVYVVLHANHPNEFTPEAITACAKLVDGGIPMLSQSLLLKGVNDNLDTLSQLMRCFIRNRIKPYYLHQGDLAQGTQHFRTSVSEGQALMKQLRGRFSGICQPTYVLDIPGGYGKVPIGPNYSIKHEHDEMYNIEDYQGNIHLYHEDL